MTQRQVSGWAIGWTWFAAVVMWIIGAFHAIAGLVALVNDEFYVVTREYIFQFDVTTWGWIHLIGGIVVFVAGIYLLSGQVLAANDRRDRRHPEHPVQLRLAALVPVLVHP